jgi:hypothetical protein
MSPVPILDFSRRRRGRRRGLTARLALRKHIEMDMKFVMDTLTQCMAPPINGDMEKEAEAACQCAESWVTYGIGAKYEYSHTMSE